MMTYTAKNQASYFGVRSSAFSIMIFFIFSLFSLAAHANSQKVIKLVDGSQLNGEVIGFNNGLYTIQSHSLGRIQIEESRIHSIHFKKDAVPAQSNSANSGQVSQMITKMTTDRNIMGLVSSLQNSPELKSVMSDPEIMNAITSGNYEVLFNNPKFRALMQNEKVQAIQQKMLQ